MMRVWRPRHNYFFIARVRLLSLREQPGKQGTEVKVSDSPQAFGD